MKYLSTLIIIFIAAYNVYAGQINAWKYWFNDDYQSHVHTNLAVPVSLFELNTNINLPATNLPKGMHLLNIMFRDTSGKWSVPFCKRIYYYHNIDDIVEYEYWLNEDYNNKTTVSFNNTNTLQVSDTLFFENLDFGTYIFNIRFKNSFNFYSPPHSRMFLYDNSFKQDKNIVGYTYWFDEDYENSVSVEVPQTDVFHLIDYVNTQDLSFGIHKFNIIFEKSDNRFSAPFSTSFFNNTFYEENNGIVVRRHWLDNDYSTVEYMQTDSVTTELDYVNILQMPIFQDSSLHNITYQFKDSAGVWSSPISKDFLFVSYGIAQPLLISPLNESNNLSGVIQLKWRDNSLASRYQLQIAVDSNFQNIIVDSNSITNDFYNFSTWQFGQKYFWRLRAFEDSTMMVSPWSDTWNFTAILSQVVQNIGLNAGWNLISSNVVLQNLNMSSILQQLQGKAVLIKNMYGLIYSPPFATNLDSWNNDQAYMIYMTMPDTLTLSGNAISPVNSPINFNRTGWYWLPYFRTSQMNTQAALSSIQGQFSEIKSDSGGIFVPNSTNTLPTLEPGKGYIIRIIDENAILVYPAN